MAMTSLFVQSKPHNQEVGKSL